MNELQALVTGMLMGALLGQNAIDLTIQALYDEEGNYLPQFVVQGNVTGTRLRIRIEMDE